jgi:hypothetical protein
MHYYISNKFLIIILDKNLELVKETEEEWGLVKKRI